MSELFSVTRVPYLQGGESTSPNRTIYVGGIPEGVEESDLKRQFTSFGRVLSVHLRRTQLQRQSSSIVGAETKSFSAHKYAFVTMASHEEAHACIRRFRDDQYLLDWAYENTVLIVTNLPLNLTLDEIHQQFGQFGEIDEAASDEGVRRRAVGNSKWAKLRFLDRLGAIRARRAFDHCLIGGESIRVDWYISDAPSSPASPLPVEAPAAEHREYRSTRSPFAGRTIRNSASVYVRFESCSTSAVNEPLLRSIFAAYAPIDGVSIKHRYTDAGTGRQRGSCFVHFSNDEAGRAAVLAASRDLQRSERLGVLLSAEVSNTFRQYMERQGQGQGQRRRDLHALGERSQGMDGRDGSMHSPNQHVEMTFTDNAVYLPRLSHSFQPSYDLGAPAPASVMVPHAVGPILIPNGNLYYRPLYTGRINAVGQQIDPLQFVYYQQQDMISIPVASSMQSYAYGYAGERPFLLNSNNLGPSFIE